MPGEHENTAEEPREPALAQVRHRRHRILIIVAMTAVSGVALNVAASAIAKPPYLATLRRPAVWLHRFGRNVLECSIHKISFAASRCTIGTMRVIQ
jgi:hypothetical protein